MCTVMISWLALFVKVRGGVELFLCCAFAIFEYHSTATTTSRSVAKEGSIENI